MAEEKSGKSAFFKILLLGIAIGIIGICSLGFKACGWVTAGDVQEKIDEATLPLAAEICAYKFKADPNFEENLAALKKMSSWEKNSYIREKGKWSVMAGEDEDSTRYEVANECVEKLADLLE